VNKHLSIAMFLLGACLALGFVYGMGKVSNAVAQFKQSNAIRVKGYAERRLQSDSAAWSCSVTVRDHELQSGYARIKKDVEACRKQVLSLGVTESELSLSPIETEIKYKGKAKDGAPDATPTNEIDYYILTQRIHVASQDVGKTDRVSKEVTDLIAAGIEVRSDPVAFTCSQIEKVKLEMLAEAAQNARERAAALAERSNGTVGPLISADQGVFQIVPLQSTEVSGEGIYDTSTIQKTIKSVVTMEFAVQK
jgi:hypothetical protein